VPQKRGWYRPYERTNNGSRSYEGRTPTGRALADLYDLLVRGLGAALGGNGGGVEANFGDFAQEALIKITSNLDSFRGESRFTT
jgi:DNA-directed RNA polymerase specialized sigma24 family protein